MTFKYVYLCILMYMYILSVQASERLNICMCVYIYMHPKNCSTNQDMLLIHQFKLIMARQSQQFKQHQFKLIMARQPQVFGILKHERSRSMKALEMLRMQNAIGGLRRGCNLADLELFSPYMQEYIWALTVEHAVLCPAAKVPAGQLER